MTGGRREARSWRLRPHTEYWDWQRRAACRSIDNAVFFHPDGERGPARAQRELRAKSICETCPVRRDCLLHALIAREPYGIWGGLGERERRLLVDSEEERPRSRRER